MENVRNIMKKCCIMLPLVKSGKDLFKFMIAVGAITIFGEQHTVFAESKNHVSCVVDQFCETKACDLIIQKIVVDYYDDLGIRYRWTHKVHIDEGLTRCEAAIGEHFPYQYSTCE